MFGQLPAATNLGDWVRIPFSGHPLARVDIKLGSSDWRTCYHDDRDVMVRARVSGNLQARVKVDGGEEQVLGIVKVIDSSDKV